jgi:hypothetical protein
MDEDWIELVASSRKKDVDEAASILKTTPIQFRVSGNPRDSISKDIIGEVGGAKHFLSVHKEDYLPGQQALRDAYIKIPLPGDHYLWSFSNKELLDLVGNAEEWSAYDVAHAVRLADERGLDTARIEINAEEKLEKRFKARNANRKTVVCVVAIILFYIFARFIVRYL